MRDLHTLLLMTRLCLFMDQIANTLKYAEIKCLGQIYHEGKKRSVDEV